MSIMPTTQALLSIMTLGIMLKTAFLIGTIQALPSITAHSYYVIKSILEWDYSSLVCVNDVWHYVENGVYSNDYTGLTKYYGTCIM